MEDYLEVLLICRFSLLLHGLGRSKIQRLRKQEHERDPESKQWHLIVYREERKPGSKWLVLEILREVFVPILVLVVGVFCSVAALTTL